MSYLFWLRLSLKYTVAFIFFLSKIFKSSLCEFELVYLRLKHEYGITEYGIRYYIVLLRFILYLRLGHYL